MTIPGESAWAAAGWSHYDILDVDDDAEIDEIRSAFRQRAQELHPDLHPGDPDAAEAMRAVNEAWAILGNATRRAKYDDSRRRATASPTAPADFEVPQHGHSLFPQQIRIPITVVILIVLAVIFVVTAYAGPR